MGPPSGPKSTETLSYGAAAGVCSAWTTNAEPVLSTSIIANVMLIHCVMVGCHCTGGLTK